MKNKMKAKMHAYINAINQCNECLKYAEDQAVKSKIEEFINFLFSEFQKDFEELRKNG